MADGTKELEVLGLLLFALGALLAMVPLILGIVANRSRARHRR